MQGAKLEESVLQALDRVNARIDDFDVVVIIRGGGATSELANFDSYMLASACAQFPLPIITGIGHERDDTVLDIVAHTRVKTPTAAAELLIQYMVEAVESLNTLKNRLYNGTKQLLKNKKGKLDLLTQSLPAGVTRRLSVEKLKFQETRSRLKFLVHKKLTEQRHQLEMWELKVLDASPEKQLARGYSITLIDGHAVKSVDAIKKGDSLKTILANGVLMSEVEEVINNKEE
jgi:exodeoxyribonuclease VII large subunit